MPIIPANTIAQLPSANTITGAEYFPITQAGNTVKAQIGNIGGGNAPGILPITANNQVASSLMGEHVYHIYNTTNAALTFYLPVSPALSEIVTIVDAGLSAGTYTQTISGNGNNIIAYGTATNSSIQFISNGSSIRMAWDGTNWVQNA